MTDTRFTPVCMCADCITERATAAVIQLANRQFDRVAAQRTELAGSCPACLGTGDLLIIDFGPHCDYTKALCGDCDGTGRVVACTRAGNQR